MYFCNGKNTCLITWPVWRHFGKHHLSKDVLLSRLNPSNIISKISYYSLSRYFAPVAYLSWKTQNCGFWLRLSRSLPVLIMLKVIYGSWLSALFVKASIVSLRLSMFWFCCHFITNGWILLKFGIFMYFSTRITMEALKKSYLLRFHCYFPTLTRSELVQGPEVGHWLRDLTY